MAKKTTWRYLSSMWMALTKPAEIRLVDNAEQEKTNRITDA